MLTEKTIIDQITVNEENIVSVRESTIIERDGVELSRTYHRTTLAEGADISSYPQKVQDICNAAWVSA